MSRELVEVYADWHPIEQPLLIGQLAYSDSSRGGVLINAAKPILYHSIF